MNFEEEFKNYIKEGKSKDIEFQENQNNKFEELETLTNEIGENLHFPNASSGKLKELKKLIDNWIEDVETFKQMVIDYEKNRQNI